MLFIFILFDIGKVGDIFAHNGHRARTRYVVHIYSLWYRQSWRCICAHWSPGTAKSRRQARSVVTVVTVRNCIAVFGLC
jgi:hypothetical protein